MGTFFLKGEEKTKKNLVEHARSFLRRRIGVEFRNEK